MDFNVEYLINEAWSLKASDLHITCDAPPVFRINGKLNFSNHKVLDKEELEELINPFLTEKMKQELSEGFDVDFSFQTGSGLRTRVNVYKQCKSLAMAVRLLNDFIPTMQQLGLPAKIVDFCKLDRGMILVTGPTGSGKSTSLASMIDFINCNWHKHIITIEDPIEYVHTHKQCMVTQREMGVDFRQFGDAVRAALREDPDVILVGEMRDYETIQTAITAAETGHLVFSTLHTTGAANTIDRMIDVFPQGQKDQIRVQLASVLKGVMSQQLLPTRDGSGRIAAIELLNVTDGVANLIRENKTHQINSVVQTSTNKGMQALDIELAKLVSNGVVDINEASEKCMDITVFNSYLKMNNSQQTLY